MTPLVRCFESRADASALTLRQSTAGVGVGAADERASIERFLDRKPGMSFVAEQDGQLLATILCGHDGGRGLSRQLVVAPQARRRGLARSLLRPSVRALHSSGIDNCHVLVFRDNPEGAAFWRSVSAAERHDLALFSLSTGIGDRTHGAMAPPLHLGRTDAPM